MPIYEFYNPETEEQWETKMSYEEMKQFVADNPQLHQIFQMNFAHASGSDGGGKVPDHFKEVMSRVAEQNPNTPVAEKYGSKSIRDVKTREAIDKARKKAGGSLIG
jgi:hypothetical protein